MVAWTETSIDVERDEPVSAVFVAPSDGSGEPRQFSTGPHDLLARWSPDGHYLAFLSAHDGPPALKLAPLAGGDALIVGAPGRVKGFEWSPDGSRLVLVVNVPDHDGGGDGPASSRAPRVVRGLFNRFDGVGWLEGRDHLFLYDVAAATTSVLTSGDFDHASPTWSPDGSTVAFVSDRSRDRDDRVAMGDVWAMDVAGRRRAPRRIATDLLFGAGLSYSPDGKRLAFTGLLGQKERAGRDSRLLVVDPASGRAPEIVAPVIDRPTAYSFGLAAYRWLGPDELAFTVADGGATGIRRSRLGEHSGRPVLGDDRQVLALSVAPADGSGRRRLAFSSAWVDSPGEIYVLELGRRAPRPLRVSRASEPLSSVVGLRPAKRFRTVAPDGVEVEYLALRPESRRSPGGAGPETGKAAGARRGTPPLFVEVHGGPAMQNPVVQIMFHYQVLVAAGYTVILPNPRGSIGYGEKFTSKSLGDWGDGPFGDILACADDAIARGLADPATQFIGGYSYGGYMSSFAVGRTRRFKGAAIGAPVVNLTSQIGSADVGRFLSDAIGNPWRARELIESQSPITYAHSATTPVLLYVNEGDLRCPPSQSDELYTALKWRSRDVEYVRYPGGSHLSVFTMVGYPSQTEDREQRMLGWLARHGGVANSTTQAPRKPAPRKAAPRKAKLPTSGPARPGARRQRRGPL